MKISDILGFKHNGLEAVEAKLNGSIVWEKASPEIAFTSCPFPTSWTKVTLGTHYESSNEYGDWEIIASSYTGSSYYADNAFDGSTDTYWRCDTLDSLSDTATLEIICPVLIKPTQIYIYRGLNGDLSKLQGYNPKTGEYEDIMTIPTSRRGGASITQDIAINNYYNKFKITINKAGTGSAYKNPRIWEFQIRSGLIKEA